MVGGAGLPKLRSLNQLVLSDKAMDEAEILTVTSYKYFV